MSDAGPAGEADTGIPRWQSWSTSPTGRLVVLALSVVGLVAIGVVDYVTGPDLNMVLLYLLPVMALSWTYGIAGGAPAALAAGVAGYIGSRTGSEPVSAITTVWDVVVRTGVFLVVVWLVDQQRRLLDLHHLAATHDPLTSALNRRGFLEASRRVVHRASRDGLPVSLLFADLDGFKVVNDSLGHEAGDAVIVRFAQEVTAELRPSDLFGRLGGDEFGVLLPGADRSEASGVAQRLLDRLQSHGTNRDINVSIGLATETTATKDVESLLRQADDAMYAAKRAGGATFRVAFRNSGPRLRSDHDPPFGTG